MSEILDNKIDNLAELLASIDGVARGGLDTTQALRMLAETATSALTQSVAQARAEGATWDQVGRALGTTRQAAQQRYGG